MENPRPEKVAVVDEVRERLDATSAALLTEYRGLDVTAISDLRRALRAAGASTRSTRTRSSASPPVTSASSWRTCSPARPRSPSSPSGPMARPAMRSTWPRRCATSPRTNPNLVVKGGVLGTQPLTADEAKALADVEPREVLLAKFAGALAAPMVQFAGLLEALPRNFAYGLQALIDQQGGVPDTPAESLLTHPKPPPSDAPEAEARRRPTPSTDAPAEEAPSEEPAARPTTTDARRAAEEAPAEEPRGRRHHHGGVSTMPTKEDILESIANMTVLELSELLKDFEEKFGVTAAAPVAVAPPPPPVAAPPPRPRRRRTSSTSSSPRPATRRSRSSRRCARSRTSVSRRPRTSSTAPPAPSWRRCRRKTPRRPRPLSRRPAARSSSSRRLRLSLIGARPRGRAPSRQGGALARPLHRLPGDLCDQVEVVVVVQETVRPASSAAAATTRAMVGTPLRQEALHLHGAYEDGVVHRDPGGTWPARPVALGPCRRVVEGRRGPRDR